MKFRTSLIRVALLLALTLVSVAIVSSTSGTASASPHDRSDTIEIVAVGDSYSAGVGLGDVTEPCDQDRWGTHIGIVTSRLSSAGSLRGTDIRYFLAACTGAVTGFGLLDDSPWYRAANWVEPQEEKSILWQIQTHVNSDTDVVTITAGGNDIGFASMIGGCWTGRTCGNDALNLDVASNRPSGDVDWDLLYDRLVLIYTQARSKMDPDGHVYVLTYPIPFNISGIRCDNLSQTEQAAANSLATRLGDVIWLAAQEADRRAGNVELVEWRQGVRLDDFYTTPRGEVFDTYSSPTGICGDNGSTLNGFVNNAPINSNRDNSYHPSAFGYSQAADLLFEAMAPQLISPTPTPTPTVPEQVSRVTCVYAREGVFELEWASASNSTGYEFRLWQAGAFGPWLPTNSLTTVALFINEAAGRSFQVRAVNGAGSGPPSAISNQCDLPPVSDFDGDGTSDLFMYGSGSDPDVVLLFEDGDWRIGPGRDVTGVYLPVAGDFDGDGLGDVFLHGPGDDPDRLLLADGGGSFVVRTPRQIQGSYQPVGPNPHVPDVRHGVPRSTCAGHTVTVDLGLGESPTDGPDVIRGTPGPDVINALGGNDVICALQGHDVIFAGDGFDQVFAAAGNDVIIGGAGNDRLVGGLGDDTIEGRNGNDRLQGGDGNDDLSGGNGTDRLAGGNGNDILRGGSFDDHLFGNLGRDLLFGDDGNDVLRGGAWLDEMDGGSGSNDGCTLTDPAGLQEVRIDCESGVFGR